MGEAESAGNLAFTVEEGVGEQTTNLKKEVSVLFGNFACCMRSHIVLNIGGRFLVRLEVNGMS